MILAFVGQDYKYQVESLVKMFFPVERFSILYGEIPQDENAVITVERRRKSGYRLLAVVRTDGKVTVKRRILPLTAELSERRLALCAALYKALCEGLGTELPWGMLTGVRPVKQVHALRGEGKNDEEIRRFFSERFFVSQTKSNLCLMTADVQEGLEMGIRPQMASLYVSIPFCPTRCAYCSFVSQAVEKKGTAALIGEYVDKLCGELQATAEVVKQCGLQLETVYFGGGTPTSLSAGQLGILLDCIERSFDLSHLKEYTVEAGRADTITADKLEVLHDHGVGRISINPQSFNDRVLEQVGRRHTARQVVDAYHLARSVGFETINMDLIAGLPGDTLESFERTVEQAVVLAPENITVHALTIKRSSALHEQGRAGGGDAPAMVTYAGQRLLREGYRPYYLYRQKNMVDNLENVGYAKPGHESPYNIYIMEENQTILACGAGGSTKLVAPGRIERIFNYKYPYEYCNGFEEILRRKQEVVRFYGQQEASEHRPAQL